MSTEPWGHLIDLERVQALQGEGVRRYETGIIDAPRGGCVEGSLGSAWSAEQYQETEEGVCEGLIFAGYVLFYLAKNHCFTDGNKRVAWLSATWVLATLGVSVDASDDEAEQMVLAVVQGEIPSGAEVVRWLADRLVAAPDQS